MCFDNTWKSHAPDTSATSKEATRKDRSIVSCCCPKRRPVSCKTTVRKKSTQFVNFNKIFTSSRAKKEPGISSLHELPGVLCKQTGDQHTAGICTTNSVGGWQLNYIVVTTTTRFQFYCYSTALRPLNVIRYDSRPAALKPKLHLYD